MDEEYELRDNEPLYQYEFHVGEEIPRIEYIKSLNGEIYLTHTKSTCRFGRERHRFAACKKGAGGYRTPGVEVDSLMSFCGRVHSCTSGMETHCIAWDTCMMKKNVIWKRSWNIQMVP